MPSPTSTRTAKPGLHARNRHRAGYDFEELTQHAPELASFVRLSPRGEPSIDFATPAAVLALNRALLRSYGIEYWEIPDGYLCPPVPGRADYIHHVADLLATDARKIPRGPSTVALDIGVGANCIYPIVGRSEYGWRFVGADSDAVALRSCERIVAANPLLRSFVTCRLQANRAHIFQGLIAPNERFDVTICNPPFHATLADADAGTLRKLRNLGRPARGRPVLNFGGHASELCYPGGEAAFLQRMIAESVGQAEHCRWFTSLVSKSDHLPAVQRALQAAAAREVRVIAMAQGQKKSRIVAWSFLDPARRRAWRQATSPA